VRTYLILKDDVAAGFLPTCEEDRWGSVSVRLRSPMRRRRLVLIRTDGLFGVGDAVGEAFDFALEAVDVLPLRGDGLVEVLDRLVLVGDAGLEGVEAGCIGHGTRLMTEAAGMLHARP
jgi:hypothetical protein